MVQRRSRSVKLTYQVLLAARGPLCATDLGHEAGEPFPVGVCVPPFAPVVLAHVFVSLTS